MFNYDLAMSDVTSSVFTNIHSVDWEDETEEDVDPYFYDFFKDRIEDDDFLFLIEYLENYYVKDNGKSVMRKITKEAIVRDESIASFFLEIDKDYYKSIEVLTYKEFLEWREN